MSDTKIPSIDPADRDDFTGAFRHIFNKMMQNTDDMLPAKVLSYDRTTNRATVQPLIMVVTTDDTAIQRPPVASIPVMQYGGGGFMVSAPVKAGDIGWIKANDRDISLFLQGGDHSPPNTFRKKSFSDAMFIPDVMGGYTIDGADTNNLVVQSLDGTSKVSVGTDKITLKVGGVSLEVSASGVAITGGTVTHDGIDIGKTHTNGGFAIP